MQCPPALSPWTHICRIMHEAEAGSGSWQSPANAPIGCSPVTACCLSAPLTVTGGWPGEREEIEGEEGNSWAGRQLRAVNSGQCLECQSQTAARQRIWKQSSWISLLSQIRRLKIATNDKTESDLSPIEWCLPSTHTQVQARFPQKIQYTIVNFGGS